MSLTNKHLSKLVKGQDLWHEPINENVEKLNIDLLGNEFKQITTKMNNVIDYSDERASTPSSIEINGRTLVNLLGRYGSAVNQMIVHDKKNIDIVYDRGEFILSRTHDDVPDDAVSYFGIQTKLKTNGYYIFLFDITDKNENVNPFYPQADIQYHDGLFYHTSDTVSLGIFNCTTDIPLIAHPVIYVNDHVYTGEICKLRNLRLYEISKEEALSFSNETVDELIKKYPYVESVSSIVNPYIMNKVSYLVNDRFTPSLTFGGTGYQAAVYRELFSVSGRHIVKPNTNYTLLLSEPINISGAKLTYKFSDDEVRDIYQPTINPITDLVKIDLETSPSDSHVFNVAIILSKAPTPDEIDMIERVRVQLIPTELYNENVLDYINSEITFNTKLHEGETLYKDKSGKYVKTVVYNELLLDRNNYDVMSGRSDDDQFSSIHIRDAITDYRYEMLGDVSYFNGYMQLHDGSVLNSDRDYRDYWFINNHAGTKSTEIYMYLHKTVTGWGEGYIPTTEEIHAYLNGWIMADVNNNNNPFTSSSDPSYKRWYAMWTGEGQYNSITGTSSNGTATVPTTLAPNCNHISLLYRTTTIQKEEVETIDNLLLDDIGIIETGSGRMYNEKFTKHGEYYLNDNGNRAEIFRQIKNGNQYTSCYSSKSTDPHLTGMSTIAEYGIIESDNISCNYDLYKPDTVSSFDVKITYPTTTKGIIDELIKKVTLSNQSNTSSDITVDISFIENMIFALSDRVENIDRNLVEINQDIDGIVNSVNALNSSVSYIEPKITTIESDIRTHAGTISGINSSLTTITPKVDKIAGMEESIHAHNTKITTNTTSINSQNNRINTINAVIDHMKHGDNFLLNSNFNINQRSGSQYTVKATGVYTVDRWCTIKPDYGPGTDSKVSPNYPGVYVEGTSNIKFAQIIDVEELGIIGRTVTFSMQIGNNTPNSDPTMANNGYFINGFASAPTTSSPTVNIKTEKYTATSGTVKETFVIPSGIKYLAVGVYCMYAGKMTLNWAKLELDSYTSYTAPDTNTEYIKCQQYAQHFDQFAPVQIMAPTYTTCRLPINGPMRTTPTIIDKGSIVYTNRTAPPFPSLASDYASVSGAVEKARNAVGLTFNAASGKNVSTGDKIIQCKFTVDAEIY